MGREGEGMSGEAVWGEGGCERGGLMVRVEGGDWDGVMSKMVYDRSVRVFGFDGRDCALELV